MLDLRLIREDPDGVRAALARRGDQAGLDAVIEADRRARELRPELEDLAAARNRASEAIAQAKRAGEDADAAIAEQRELAARQKELEQQVSELEAQRHPAGAHCQPARGERDPPSRRGTEGHCGRHCHVISPPA